jgi:hypothetical protein
MASGGNEHRMVFDIRGKRRHVVKFVYAILALLMGASLFLLAGPGIGGLFSSGNSVSSATAQFEEQAERIEHKLVKSPEDPELLLALTKTRINAGNSAVEQTSTGELVPTVESQQQLQKASAAWSEYLEATSEPSAGGAQLAANALFSLAQTSRTTAEAEANIKAASEAQKIVADARPDLNTLSTYALYTLFTFDYAAAEKANEEASKLTTSKFQREELEKNFEAVKKRAEEFQKQIAEASKAAKQGAKAGANPESLENPLGAGLGGTGSSE